MKKIITYVLTITMLFVFSISNVNASNLKIHINPDSSSHISNQEFVVFNVDHDDKAALDALSYSQLTNSYPSYKNTTRVYNLERGYYYIVLFENESRSQLMSPILIYFDEDLVINPKLLVKTGSAGLVKEGYDKSKFLGLLKDVQFELYEENGLKPLRFKNGKFTTDLDGVTTLVTDAEGKIKVDNLLPGKYYFKEIKTLAGYILNKDKIEVNVGDTFDYKIVKNYREDSELKNLIDTSSQNNLIWVMLLLASGLVIVLLYKNKNVE